MGLLQPALLELNQCCALRPTSDTWTVSAEDVEVQLEHEATEGVMASLAPAASVLNAAEEPFACRTEDQRPFVVRSAMDCATINPWVFTHGQRSRVNRLIAEAPGVATSAR